MEHIVNPRTDDTDVQDAARRRFDVMKMRTEWVRSVLG